MHKLTSFALALLIGLSALSFGSSSTTASPAFAKQDDLYHMTKRGVKKGWRKSKNISKKVWYKGKWVTVKSWRKGNQIGKKVWYKGKWVTLKTARGTKRVIVG